MRLLIFALLLPLVFSYENYESKVLLRDIQTLTFTRGQWSTARRSPPVQQLVCFGENCNGNRLSSVQCQNTGWDGRDVTWKCEAANVPNVFDLGKTTVTCEGYDYPNDPYVLLGSCGLEYELVKRPTFVHVPIPVLEKDNGLSVWFVGLFFGGVVLFLFLVVSFSTSATRVRSDVIEMMDGVDSSEERRRDRKTTYSTTSSLNTPSTNPSYTPSAPFMSSDDSSYSYSPYQQVPSQVPSTATMTTHTTYVENHHHYQRDPTNDFTSGYVMGSLNESLRKPTVIVTPVAPVLPVTHVTPVIIQPVTPAKTVVAEVKKDDDKKSDTHTSTSFATTKRR